jgi:hypothetical protein
VSISPYPAAVVLRHRGAVVDGVHAWFWSVAQLRIGQAGRVSCGGRSLKTASGRAARVSDGGRSLKTASGRAASGSGGGHGLKTASGRAASASCGCHGLKTAFDRAAGRAGRVSCGCHGLKTRTTPLDGGGRAHQFWVQVRASSFTRS